jgi:hypothetical protein
MAASNELNLFTPSQELDLGDAIAEHMQRGIPIVAAPGEIGYLEQLGARLLAHMPPTEIQFRFQIIDIPQANAFVLPGGRVYVSRKIIAFVRSEDELAGILGHEFGHVLARQGSRRMTRVMKSAMGVSAIGDRADVFAQYNRLLDGVAKKRVSGAKYVDEEVAADQLSIYALARAGYDPEAMIGFFDRLTENKGATGGVVSDFFSLTTPESKRVREMTRTLAGLPAGCRDAKGRPSADAFESWRKRVAELPSVRIVTTLAPLQPLIPRLRPDIRHVTFSPDGKWVAAQDDSGVQILTVDPFLARFRIPAPDAQKAVFSPDAKEISFLTSTQRVERWELATGKRLRVRDVVTGTAACAQRVLAPGGRWLACRTPANDLRLYDVETSMQVAHKEFDVSPMAQLLMTIQGAANRDEEFRLLLFAFSPDGKYFLASPRGGTSLEAPWAYDLEARANLPLPGPLKATLPGGFAFLGPDRVAAVKPGDPNKSAIFRWPGGEVEQRVAIPNVWIEGATRGDYLILRPFQEHAAAVMDVGKSMVIKAGRTPALDIFGAWYVAERGTGELGLYSIDKSEPKAVAILPEGDLGRLRASAISPDLRRVVISTGTRSGLWKLGGEEQPALMRGLDGAAFVNNDEVVVDLPKFQKEERRIVTVNLATRKAVEPWTVPEAKQLRFRGTVLVERELVGEGPKRRVLLKALDSRTRGTLWETALEPEARETFVTEDAVVSVFVVESKFAKQVLRDPAVRERLFGGRKPAGRILQVLAARTGKELGMVAVEEPALRIQTIAVRGDGVFISDAQNRVHVYDLATGQTRGRVFGRAVALDAAGARLCVENEAGDVRVHETRQMAELGRWQLDGLTLTGRFDETGKRLLLLSARQSVYLLTPED